MDRSLIFPLVLAAALWGYHKSGLLRRRLDAIDAEDAQRGGEL